MNLRSFDIFRKIQSDIHPGTRTGGIFTMLAFVLGGLLLFHSLNEYYTEKYTTSLIIENDENPILPVQIDIVMAGAPCHPIFIKFHDEHEYEEGGLEKNLTMTRIKKDNSEEVYKRKDNRDEQRNELKAAIQSQQTCRLNGTINMPKTPGYLKIELSNNGNLLRDLHDVLHKVTTNYKLNSLQFGSGTAKQIDLPIVYQSESIKRYIMDLEGKLSKKDFVQDFASEKSNVDFLNHIKVIPVRYGESKTEHSSSDKYRYSIRSGRSDKNDALPTLTFLMEIEPINIVYHKMPRSRYQLVVRIFAIIGGVFATVGIINSIVQGLKDMFGNKVK